MYIHIYIYTYIGGVRGAGGAAGVPEPAPGPRLLVVRLEHTYIYIYICIYIYIYVFVVFPVFFGEQRTQRSVSVSRPNSHHISPRAPAARSTPRALFTLLGLCVSSSRRGRASLLCVVPILADDPQREAPGPLLLVARLEHVYIYIYIYIYMSLSVHLFMCVYVYV